MSNGAGLHVNFLTFFLQVFINLVLFFTLTHVHSFSSFRFSYAFANIIFLSHQTQLTKCCHHHFLFFCSFPLFEHIDLQLFIGHHISSAALAYFFLHGLCLYISYFLLLLLIFSAHHQVSWLIFKTCTSLLLKYIELSIQNEKKRKKKKVIIFACLDVTLTPYTVGVKGEKQRAHSFFIKLLVPNFNQKCLQFWLTWVLSM